MDFNNYKSRLKFDDIVIRSRCISKLIEAVKKKVPCGDIISVSSIKIPELNLIWETCAVEHHGTCCLAMRAIISLVTSNSMQLSFAINQTLSSITTSRNSQALVCGLTDLLLYEANKSNERNNIAKYSLQCPKHPLISVLQSKEDCWPLILDNIFRAIKLDEKKGFQVMEPVIIYVLCDPQNEGTSFKKTVMVDKFIELDNHKLKNIEYLFKLLPLFQVKTFVNVLETSNFLKKITQELNSFDDCSPLLCEQLLLCSLSLCANSFECGYDPLPILQIAVDVAKSLPQKTYVSNCVNGCLLTISSLLKNSSCATLAKLLEISDLLLNTGCPSPTVAAIVTTSMIQLLSEPSISSTDYKEQSAVMISKVIFSLENCFNSDSDICDSGDMSCHLDYLEVFTPSTVVTWECLRFCLRLDVASREFVIEWLKCISVISNCSDCDLETIFLLVSALFLRYSEDLELTLTCLEALEVIVTRSDKLSTKMFALLLYKQSRESNPEIKLTILEYLPKTATHKFAVPPVVSFLHMMANHVELKSQAIHLMLQLWKKQSRCFSYLHKLLVEKSKFVSKDTGINEILMSQAVAIKEICLTEPEKYGIEFLKMLSSIINESRDDTATPFACLAIDGVIALCKAEVIDLRTTWGNLGPSLCKDKRALITNRMYELLNLVPELEVKSPEYDKFMNDIATYVWKQISIVKSSPSCSCAAYKTLARFPSENFTLKQLPKAAKENLKLPSSMKATPFDMSKEPEDVLTYIPGYCYTDLLKSINEDTVMEGYTEFLKNLIKQEVNSMPRGMYIQKKHLSKLPKNKNDVVQEVPAFLCSQFELRKSPALQKNLAVGVLLCYEAPVETGKDGQPVMRSVAAQAKFYEQVLGVLLSEVNIDTSDWQRCVVLSPAWGSFMERAFYACEEARRTELEMQCSHGHISAEELDGKKKIAWLWVRDRLLNLIKTSGKNTPTSHANSVFAMASLVRTLNKYNASLEKAEKTIAEDCEDFTSHDVFEGQCVETLMCAMNPDYKPSAKVFSWLLTHLSRINSSASFLVQGCACASLYHVSTILAGCFADEIPTICKVLIQNLSHSSPVLSFYSGLGLGLFLKSLSEEGYAEAGHSQKNLILSSVKKIEDMYKQEKGSQSGCLTGLTLAIASISQSVQEEFRDWVVHVCDRVHEKLMSENPSSMEYEALSICVCAMMISAASGNCKPVQCLHDLASWVTERNKELPQCSGTAVSLGMLIEALGRFDADKVSEVKENLEKGLFVTLTSPKKPTLHKLAALNGICALYSGGKGLLQTKESSSAKKSRSGLNDLISLMFQIINASKDIGLQDICSWETGRLFSIHSNQQQSDSTVPDSYSYLSEKSILKPVLELITDSSAATQHKLCCLKAIGISFPRPLPPLNWASILTQFLQQDENPEIIHIALSIAIHQAGTSPNAAGLVSAYCEAPLIHTIPESCRLLLLNHISDLAASLPANKLQAFLQIIISSTIKNENEISTKGVFTMQGIVNSLKLSTIQSRSLKLVQAAFVSIFKFFKSNLERFKDHLPVLILGLSHLPEGSAESLMAFTPNEDHVPSLVALWCHLVKTGRKQLTCLRQCVEVSKHIPAQEKEEVLASLHDCFLTGRSSKESEISQPEKCTAWLLENIGWINVLTDTKSKYQLVTVKEVFLFLVDVCLATVAGCSGLDGSYSLLPQGTLSHGLLLGKLPTALLALMANDKWRESADKIINWLLLLNQSCHLMDADKYYVRSALCSVRDLQEFQKTPVWTEVVCSINK